MPTKKEGPDYYESEQGIISSILLDPVYSMNEVSGFLRPEHFYSAQHQILYRYILKLFSEKKPIDSLSLSQIIKEEDPDILKSVGGMSYIASILNSTATAANIKYYAEIIYESFYLRNFKTQIAENLDSPEKIKEILLNYEEKKRTPAEEYSLELYLKKRKEKKKRVKSTLFGKDYIFYYGGSLSFFLGRTSHRKTSLLINEAVNLTQNILDESGFILEKGKEVAFISLEENREAIADKIIVNFLNKAKIVKDVVKLENLDFFLENLKIQNLIQDFFLRLKIYESPGKIEFLERQILNINKKYKIDIFFIDYIQLIFFDDPKMSRLQRQEQIKHINQRLLNLAKEKDLIFIFGSQMNRTAEKDLKEDSNKFEILRNDTTLGREAGDIEQDANLMINLWYNNADQIMEYGIPKNRNGKKGIYGQLKVRPDEWIIEPMNATVLIDKNSEKTTQLNKKKKKDSSPQLYY